MDIEETRRLLPEAQPPRWLKWIPVAAFIVSCLSFAFAIFVLYPWHLELSKEFTALAKKIPCN
jgi:hypothetical protein